MLSPAKRKARRRNEDVLVSIALGFHSRGEKAIQWGGVSTIKRALPKGRARRAQVRPSREQSRADDRERRGPRRGEQSGTRVGSGRERKRVSEEERENSVRTETVGAETKEFDDEDDDGEK